MKCERRDLAIAKLVGGDLSPGRAARLLQHVEDCPRCRALRDGLVQQQSASRDAALASQAGISGVLLGDVLARAESSRLRHLPQALACTLFAATLIGAVALRLSTVDESTAPSTLRAPEAINEAPAVPAASQTPVRHAQVKIQLMTNNPDVVIYWLGDSVGD